MKHNYRLALLLLLPLALLFAAVSVRADVIHVVQPGDTLFEISIQYGVSMEAIAEANDIENIRVIRLGRELIIPGVDPIEDDPPASAAPATPAAPTTPTTAPTNLFKNGSFEEDWYYYIFNELQIPNSWQLRYDEGANTLQPGSGGNFNRPEVRVVGRASFPEEEQNLFVFEGDKSVKAFKGSAPTTFSFFQDVHLQPGRYRMTANFFPDIVAHYFPGSNREWHSDPLSGEVRVIHNDTAQAWTTVTAGEPNSRVYEFRVSRAGAVRLGAAFRNRFETANNGWFLDNWKLERIGN